MANPEHLGFPIAITKFCTPDNITLCDKHLQCLENEGHRRHPAKGSQRLPHAGRRLASCRLTKPRLINV
jgi:hypothetical protein